MVWLKSKVTDFKKKGKGKGKGKERGKTRMRIKEMKDSSSEAELVVRIFDRNRVCCGEVEIQSDRP